MTDIALLEQPLFLGMTNEELSSFRLDGVFSIGTVRKGVTLVCEDGACNHLIILVEGTVMCECWSSDRSYSMQEILHAPLIIQPDRLFGMYQRYSVRCTSTTACKLVTIKKNDVLRMMSESVIFRINYLNMLTSNVQRCVRNHWHQHSEDIPQRVIRFVKDHCQYPAGYKKLCIKMNTMARELGCSRLEVSQALHLLEDRQLIRIRREAVEIPELRLLAL